MATLSATLAGFLKIDGTDANELKELLSKTLAADEFLDGRDSIAGSTTQALSFGTITSASLLLLKADSAVQVKLNGISTAIAGVTFLLIFGTITACTVITGSSTTLVEWIIAA